MILKVPKIVIVGSGVVGSTIAFSLLGGSVVGEIVMIDINMKKAEGEILDLRHSMVFQPSNTKLNAGTYADCDDADIVIVTAAAPIGNETNRLKMLEKTKGIVESIVDNVKKN